MNQLTLLVVGILTLAIGSVLGYFARQSIARKKAGSIEAKLQNRVTQVKHDAELILQKAEEKATEVIENSKKDVEEQRRELFNTERLLLKRENLLSERLANQEEKEKDFHQKVDKLKEIKMSLESLRQEALSKLETIGKLSRDEAKKELLEAAEREYQKEIMEKMHKLEAEGADRYERRAKEILASVIQTYALSQAQELTTTTVTLPSDDIKGRIIGKEGRNIKTLEKLTGVEIVVDDTPETVLISGFNPVRRQIAKTALEKLIKDGRIQPARIEEMVQKAEEEIVAQIKEAGEKAVFETEVLDLDPKLVQILGRLRFRTSYGQNVLLNSIETSLLAGALASELGLNMRVAKKAGLLHDIGKAIDHQIEGPHVAIGIKILEKFKVEKAVIDAMKSHHGEYPAESLEAIVVQTADQISGARPGARRDTVENYLRRLEDLEGIATAFPGVEKAYAIQAGREIRVFVRPEELDDLAAKKLARDIANQIQQELKYPGEIRVIVIRETRIVEFAK